MSSHVILCLSLFNITIHTSPISDECQTQSAKVLALSRERACQENLNNTPQPIIGFL